ncbi:asparagine synthase (glutamine-hydrolyzing) [Pseudodesulfovibrio sp.]|uniref:asparagine synthase (glutamine-hydrolyzing) n=1 Tax=unclassified Pseudodesulfovibrio TaxID=2661612 RepID=UPI003AFF9B76
MCGINGFILPEMRGDTHGLTSLARRMADALAHRGPDDNGTYADPVTGMALGHRRLSILDLSPAGAQPMRSASGRFILAHNGEIYNFKELRRSLEEQYGPIAWCSDSDTEVMLAAFELRGVDAALESFTGMFACALWDTQDRTLYLARDRMGEKPLYYAKTDQGVVFGSELKALHANPAFRPELDPQSLALYLRYQYVPEPRSIYSDTFKLQPGYLLTIRADAPHELNPRPWWTLKETVEHAQSNPFAGSETEAANRLETLLGNAVARQMVADVPLGSLLSGGIDSSLITALMQARSSRPVRTFTIGFSNPDYDESTHARRVAEHLGTEHTELVATPDHVLKLVETLPDLYDEPFSDSSQLPTHLVAALTREHVTVCLTGDGGDETFGGYNRHLWAPALWARLGHLPAPVRSLTAGAMRLLPPGGWDRLFHMADPILPARAKITTPGHKAHKLADALSASTREALYKQIVSTWQDPSALLSGITEPQTTLDRPDSWPSLPDYLSWMQYIDTVTYLPGDVLHKVDRATMGVALESRAPFLDHHVLEFAWSLPRHMLVSQNKGKLLLRTLLDRHVPRSLMERPKAGFDVPLDQWLRGPLRNWANELLAPDRLRHQGLLNPEPIARCLADHLSGRRNNQYRLWNLLMLQMWYERWM